ncbi:hypothetical protein EDD86DRAFT_247174 [Gorgonomyces haynaldii]|nr:hypothetical protein EDD86DRAFT_247174 [Gorgonomyces haynaldii]
MAIQSKGFLRESADQLWIMLKRNAVLQRRAWGSTLAQTVIAPIVFCLLLFVLQQADTKNKMDSNPHPLETTLPGVQRCQGKNNIGDPCITLMFYPSVLPAVGTLPGLDIAQALNVFAKKNSERTGYELKTEQPRSTFDAPDRVYDIVPVPSADFIYDYTLQNPNTTAWGVVFNQTGTTIRNVQYQVWFNATNTRNGSDIYDRTVLSLVRGLDEALISVLNDPEARVVAEMDVRLKDWPKIAPARVSEFIIQTLGPVFFFCSEMIIFINVLSTIVSEKELKLRHGMEVMGLKPYIYWTSHFISNSWLVIVNAFFTCAAGYAFQFEAFKNANFGVILFTYIFFGEAMVLFAFFITTFVRTTRIAILIGIFVFIIGLLFESFVYSSQLLGYIWWSESTIPSVGWMCLSILPFFNFGRMFLDITTLTTGSYDALTNTYIPGPGFPWSQLYDKIDEKLLPLYGDNLPPNLPPPVQTWYILLLNVVGYWLLTWYLDNVIPNEFGYKRPIWFFLTLDYWGLKKHSATNIKEWQTKNSKQIFPPETKEDQDVTSERQKALDENYHPALKIVNLQKEYKNLTNRKNNKLAVKGVCYTVEQGTLLALLGQNGAGKSTTISMLSGLTPATNGDALIFNYSVRTQMNEIRKIMGICPQHDILFDDLTAREHIELYAGLKGVPKSEWKDLIEQRLQMVRLLSVADVRAGTYSGGMKRRLSLVISTIGDPQIVFMDEPTTGMDPVNRRHVWSFVEEFKKERVIVLTTHSMEEADVLGDRIAYRISAVVNKLNADRVKEIIQKMIPGAELDDDSAGALVYKFSNADSIPTFVQWLESGDGAELVKTWGISQSTLEEVFLRLTRESKP